MNKNTYLTTLILICFLITTSYHFITLIVILINLILSYKLKMYFKLTLLFDISAFYIILLNMR